MWTLVAGWCAVAWADPAVATTTDDGTVVVVGVVSAPEGAVRELLADTDGGLRELFPEVLSVEARPAGACEDVRRQTRGPLRPLWLHVRRCATTEGWREELVADGGVFSDYASEWRLASVDHGTRVEYRVKVALGLPVPGSVVLQGVRQSAQDAVDRLIARFSRDGGSTSSGRPRR